MPRLQEAGLELYKVVLCGLVSSGHYSRLAMHANLGKN